MIPHLKIHRLSQNACKERYFWSFHSKSWFEDLQQPLHLKKGKPEMTENYFAIHWKSNLSLPHLFPCLLLLVILNRAVINTITGARADTLKNRQHSPAQYTALSPNLVLWHDSIIITLFLSVSGPRLGSRKSGSNKKTINHCRSRHSD